MRIHETFVLALVLAFAAWPMPSGPAWALSEIQREDLPAPGRPAQPGKQLPAPSAVPAPDAPAAASPAEDDDGTPEATPGAAVPDDAEAPDPERPEVSETAELPDVSYDIAALPEPVRRMHGLLLEACKGADIERLRPLIGTGDDATQLSLNSVDGDIVDFLKQSSGDGKGLEILAILEEVLSAGYVHLDPGKPEDLYVWPYFFAIPLDRLTNRQQVELFKIVTAGDVEEMKTYGTYIFYRVGITPEGHWAFFVAGD